MDHHHKFLLFCHQHLLLFSTLCQVALCLDFAFELQHESICHMVDSNLWLCLKHQQLHLFQAQLLLVHPHLHVQRSQLLQSQDLSLCIKSWWIDCVSPSLLNQCIKDVSLFDFMCCMQFICSQGSDSSSGHNLSIGLQHPLAHFISCTLGWTKDSSQLFFGERKFLLFLPEYLGHPFLLPYLEIL